MDAVALRCLLACSTSAAHAVSGSGAAAAASGVFIIFLAAFVLIRPLRKQALRFLGILRNPLCITALAVPIALVAMLFPAVQQAREAARRSSCDCNLKQIGLALQTYADIYKSFPPAYTTDEKGKRMHSWRVLILPQLEQTWLYDQYDFSEPWNGPHNRQLASLMPPVYRCPSDDLAKPGETSYAAIDGPGTILAGNQGSKFGEVPDGTSNTLAVVEAAGAGIGWMEPRDVPFGTLRNGLMSPTRGGIASRHAGVCITVFADGHTSRLESTIPVKTLQALATRAGHEQINGDF